MPNHLSDPAKAALFYLLALALAFAAALMPGASTFVYMLTPAAAALVMLLVVTREGHALAGWTSLGLARPGLRYWPLALLAPFAVVGAAFAALWASGLARFALPAEVEGHAATGGFWLIFPLVLLLNLVLATLSNSLGEELGWRGYLLPKLRALGPLRASALTGLLHALWHLPVMLLTPLYHAEGSRLVVLPLFVLSVTLAGIFFGHLRLGSGSVWPAALGHSAHNLAWATFGLFSLGGSSLTTSYLAGDAGLFTALGYALLAALLWRLGRAARARAAVGAG